MIMIRRVTIDDKTIEYKLSIKNVKNINMRIKTDGNIYVSANKHISYKMIDDFIVSKKDFIFKALNKYNLKAKIILKEVLSESELKVFVLNYCKQIYPYYEEKNIQFPIIKFRKMKSRWGSCNFSKGILTFNTQLKFTPVECVEYVIWHEFTHFLHPNHSKDFYEELSNVFSSWKKCRNILKEFYI